MLGKTHMTVGIAAALAVTQPASVSEMILAVGIGGLGALISDIDVGTSASHKDADKITGLSVAVIALALFLDKFFHTGIINRVIYSSGYGKMIFGILLFVGICA